MSRLTRRLRRLRLLSKTPLKDRKVAPKMDRVFDQVEMRRMGRLWVVGNGGFRGVGVLVFIVLFLPNQKIWQFDMSTALLQKVAEIWIGWWIWVYLKN